MYGTPIKLTDCRLWQVTFAPLSPVIRKRRTTLLTAILTLVLATAIAPWAAHAQQDTLKILAYNIHHANPPSKPGFIDLPAIARVINASGADLVALQEVDVRTTRAGADSDQAAELGSLTGMYAHFVKAIDHQGGDYGVAILSRFPLLDQGGEHLPMAEGTGGEPRVVAYVTVEPVAGKPVTFANTHLDLKPENRALQAKRIAERLTEIPHPIILAGDFNAEPNSEAIGILDRHFKRSQIPNGYTIPVDKPTREIDYIMYRPANGFKVVRHVVINEPYASDHLPVYVELAY